MKMTLESLPISHPNCGFYNILTVLQILSRTLKKDSQIQDYFLSPLKFLKGTSPDGKESACNSGHSGLIPGSRRSPGEGNGNPLQHSCLGTPLDRGAWQVTVRWDAKSQP